MLEVAAARIRDEMEDSPSETHAFELSLERDTEFDTIHGGDHAKVGRIFGYAGCRFEATFHAKYDKNEFVDIEVTITMQGLRKRCFSCSGTTGDRRFLTDGPLLTIKEVRWGDNLVLIELVKQS